MTSLKVTKHHLEERFSKGYKKETDLLSGLRAGVRKFRTAEGCMFPIQ